jgi:hypothetical protein
MDSRPRRVIQLKPSAPQILQRPAIDNRHDGGVECQADQSDRG